MSVVACKTNNALEHTLEGVFSDKYKICERCGKDNHTTGECYSYWCEHCADREKKGEPVNPKGHTKARCPELLRCAKCKGMTHATEECHTKYCEHCASLVAAGLRENDSRSAMGKSSQRNGGNFGIWTGFIVVLNLVVSKSAR